MSSVVSTADAGGRPLTARSVIASTLLGVDPPRLPALALVRSGELFGLSEGATRTALSRMAAAGEVEAVDGSYHLAGPLLARHARQRSARASATEPWDGTWELAIVTAERRPAGDRARLRDAARHLRLAEVREGCWARPANLDPGRAPTARTVVDEQCVHVTGARPDDPAVLVEAFDPVAWAETAEALLTSMADAQPALDALDTGVLPTTFVLNAAVVRHLVADPVLPPSLQPSAWPADRLRSTFERFDDGFKATWRAWYRGFQPG